MLWILRQGDKAAQLEIRHNASGTGYELVTTYPEGRIVIVDVQESIDLLERTVEVLKTLRAQGWVADEVPVALNLKPTRKRSKRGDPTVH
jgi:hypothetical protein